MRIFLVFLAFTLQGCNSDLPDDLLEWGKRNVWHVETSGGKGSGWFLGNSVFITACHVVLGDETPLIVNHNRTKEIETQKVSCNEATDIAVLHVDSDYRPLTTYLSKEEPRQGARVFGVGYPLNFPMVITEGHIQVPDENQFKTGAVLFTAPTISGDSGSPLVRVVGGQIVVVGVRLAIAFIPTYAGQDLITHLGLVSNVGVIKDALGITTADRVWLR